MKEPKTVPLRIRLVKKAMGYPYHLFYYTPAGRAIFRIENAKGEFLFWEGPFIAAAVDSAMDYLRHEVDMGAVKLPSEKTDKSEKSDKKQEELKK